MSIPRVGPPPPTNTHLGDIDLDFKSVLEVYFEYSKLWRLRGGRAYGPYTSAPVMTLRPCKIDLVNDVDL